MPLRTATVPWMKSATTDLWVTRFPSFLPYTFHLAALLMPNGQLLSRHEDAARTGPCNTQPGTPMLFRSQPAGSQADPHEAIVAQLRDLAPRIKQEPFQLEETPLSTESFLPMGEPSFQAAPSNDNAAALQDAIPRARSRRGVVTVLLAICIGIGGAAAWHSYGEQAKQGLAQLVPQLLMEAPAPPQNAHAAEAEDTAATQAAMPQPQPTAEAAPPPEAATIGPEAPPPPTDFITTAPQAPPAQAALPAELAQSLETMANDIAALKSAIEDLKAGQQQLRREIAAAAEREAHPKPAPQRAKPASSQRQRTSPQAAVPPPPSRPSPPPPEATERQLPPPQRDAYIASQAPVPARLPPRPGDDNAPRPPMPLR